MIAKSVVVAMMLFLSSFAVAATPAIGTVSARGEMRVDGYTVRDSATVFDGSTVETSDVGAVLRLGNGTEVKLAADSRGTLFRNRLVLLRGETELSTSNPFQLEASGLDVSPSAPNTSGIVSLSPVNTVEVAALTGELRVRDSRGVLLASVNPSSAISFSVGPGAVEGQAAGAQAQTFSDVGVVSLVNGHYYLTSSFTGVKYEITGKDLDKYVGDKVVINGTVRAGTSAKPESVEVSSIAINGGGGISTLGKVLIGTAIGGGGAVIGYTVASAASP